MNFHANINQKSLISMIFQANINQKSLEPTIDERIA